VAAVSLDRVHRSTRRRFIVALALLSHLVTAFFVHVPMAYASMVPAAAAEPAVSPPCPDHMKMDHGSAAAQASDQAPASGASATDHEAGCKGGFCKCPCAHAQALTVPPMPAPALVARSSSITHCRVTLAPDCETSFFRPPI
jgi:hypothetical protein